MINQYVRNFQNVPFHHPGRENFANVKTMNVETIKNNQAQVVHTFYIYSLADQTQCMLQDMLQDMSQEI